jgi:FkbM family methyltransferase
MLRKISEMARPLMWRLPAPLQYAPRMWRWELVSRLANDLGVTAMAVQTEDGLVLSRVQDRTMLPWLAKAHSFGQGPQNMMALFRRLLANGGTYLDIGANIGVTTIPLAERSDIAIHAFEPDPVNFRMLVANLSINCPEHRVSLHEIALGEADSTLSFELNPTNPADNRLAGSGRPAMGEESWQRIDVRVCRLDDVIGDFAKPLVVKIDTQGAEARVVAGGQRTLGQADLIALEWDPYLLARVGGDPELVLSLVAGFQWASMKAFGSDAKSEWRSGPEVAERMRAALAGGAQAGPYYDVLAARQDQARPA